MRGESGEDAAEIAVIREERLRWWGVEWGGEKKGSDSQVMFADQLSRGSCLWCWCSHAAPNGSATNTNTTFPRDTPCSLLLSCWLTTAEVLIGKRGWGRGRLILRGTDRGREMGESVGSKWGTSRSRSRERQRWSKMVGVESEKKEGTGVRRRGLRWGLNICLVIILSPQCSVTHTDTYLIIGEPALSLSARLNGCLIPWRAQGLAAGSAICLHGGAQVKMHSRLPVWLCVKLTIGLLVKLRAQNVNWSMREMCIITQPCCNSRIKTISFVSLIVGAVLKEFASTRWGFSRECGRWMDTQRKGERDPELGGERNGKKRRKRTASMLRSRPRVFLGW